jgi:hypothetical protein
MFLVGIWDHINEDHFKSLGWVVHGMSEVLWGSVADGEFGTPAVGIRTSLDVTVVPYSMLGACEESFGSMEA